MQRFRVLIVDDSSLSREALRRTLELDPALIVTGEARTGEEAVAQVRKLKPDLVTMDLNMPGMGGLRAIEVIMQERPTPIVVISERSSTPGMDLNYEAISRGALELVPKSSVFGVSDDDVRRFAERIRLLASSGLEKEATPRPAPPPPIPVSKEAPVLLGIGASTGGPRAVARLLNDLPKDFPLPIALVQHMAEDFFDSFVRFLADASGRPVQMVEQGMLIEPGTVYVAPPRQELFIKENLVAKLLPPPPNTLISPSVDSLFFSMANALKGRGLGVLLTGMGDDGAQGLLRMRRLGARTVVQDRQSCAVFGMPKAALELGAAETVLPLEAIAPFLVEAVKSVSESGARRVVRRSPVPVPTDGRRRVVVVDEDTRVLEASRKVLEGAGYEVHTVDNPLMLAGFLRRTPMDLVLLETELTTMRGAIVAQALRRHGLAGVPVFIHSTLDEAQLKARATECGAVGYVKKGSTANLLREVNAFLGGPSRGSAS